MEAIEYPEWRKRSRQVVLCAYARKVMAQMKNEADMWKDFTMPMDTKKMAYGGFKVVIGH